MKGYLSIGAVAKQKNVSIKSLRYYDQIGVLRPAYINEKTNYRYYTEDQLYLLDAIGLCIELGIPLRDFEKYADEHGNFNLQGLLYDGKLMAEQKIMEIRKHLANVQAALDSLGEKPVHLYEESSETSDKEEPVPQNERDTFRQRNIAVRAVLTAPFTEDMLDNYSQKILRLFMLAQLLGMTATYPSGILYQYDGNGAVKKYIFIQVENYADCTDNRLHILPEGTYFCRQGTEHQIMDSARLQDVFKLSGKPFFVVESDIIDESLKEGNNTLELQLYQDDDQMPVK